MAIVTTDDKHYKDIADALRDYLDWSEEDGCEFLPSEMAKAIGEAVDKAFNNGETYGYHEGLNEGREEGETTGKDNAIRAIWDARLNYGARTNYSYFVNDEVHTPETFLPTYDIRPVGAVVDMFNPYSNGSTMSEKISMADVERRSGMVFDFSKATSLQRAFARGFWKDLNVIDVTACTSSTALSFAFYGGYTGNSVQRIEKLIVAETTVFATSTFQYNDDLTYIGFEGVIASTINISWSPLVPESTKKAILCLKNFAGTDKDLMYSVSFSEKSWELLDAEGSKAPDGKEWRDYIESIGWNY